MSFVLHQVHVHIPFRMLDETYLDVVIENRLNPEIALDAKALDSVQNAVFKECAERLLQAEISITFHGPFVDLSPGSTDADIRDVTRHRFEQVLALVPLFQPRAVVCHAGYEKHRYGYMRKRWLKNSVAMWRWFSNELNGLGSRLVLENVFESTPEDILPIFEELSDEKVGFCLDVGHQAVFSRVALDDWLNVLGPFLGQIHLHDNHGDMDAHLGLGLGNIDFSDVFGFLRRNNGIRPLITLEPHEEADLWHSLSYLKDHWPWAD